MRFGLCRWGSGNGIHPGTNAPDFDHRSVGAWSAINLGLPGGVPSTSELVLVGAPDWIGPLPGALLDLGDDFKATLPLVVLNALKNRFSINLVETQIGRVAYELLTLWARTDGTRWKPLVGEPRPGGGLRDKVYLGGVKVYDALGDLVEMTATYQYETFIQANSSTLGPVQTWTEQSGDYQTVGNLVQQVNANAVNNLASAGGSFGSTNNWTQVDVIATTMNTGTPWQSMGAMTRWSSTSSHYGHYTPGMTSSTNVLYYGTATQIAAGSFQLVVNTWTKNGVTCNGSTITGQINGTTNVTVTDTNQATSSTGGILSYFDVGGTPSNMSYRGYWEGGAVGDVPPIRAKRVATTQAVNRAAFF